MGKVGSCQDKAFKDDTKNTREGVFCVECIFVKKCYDVDMGYEQHMESGLPSNDDMREQISFSETIGIRNDIKKALDRYAELFGKWKDGNASDEEIHEMTQLSEKLESMKQNS